MTMKKYAKTFYDAKYLEMKFELNAGEKVSHEVAKRCAIANVKKAYENGTLNIKEMFEAIKYLEKMEV